MSGLPHCGQRTERVRPPGPSAGTTGPGRRDAVRRAAWRGPRRSSSVVHAGHSTNSHVDALVAGRSACRRGRRRMASIAGQPEYVGVIVTWTRPWSSSATSRRMPRSSMVTTGISGSSTVGREVAGPPFDRGSSRSRSSPGRPRVRAVRGAASRPAGSPRCSVCRPCAATGAGAYARERSASPARPRVRRHRRARRRARTTGRRRSPARHRVGVEPVARTARRRTATRRRAPPACAGATRRCRRRAAAPSGSAWSRW